MTDTNNDPEGSLNRFLREIGSQGWLDQSLTDADLEPLLSLSSVQMSSTFEERAMLAIQQAQQGRRRLLPAAVLGNAISAARRSTGLDIAQVARKVALRSLALESLELGHTPLAQFLRDCTPTTTARLLKTIRMSLDDFSRYLTDWATHQGDVGGIFAGRPAFRQQRSTSEGLAEEVAEYLIRVEDLMR